MFLLENSTVYANTAANGGAMRIYGQPANTVNIVSSIVSGNVGTNPDFKNYDTPTNITNSLIGSSAGIDAPNIDAYTNANKGYSVLLGPLQNNGGPTSTMELLATNTKGINEGSSTATYDQRGVGFPRIIGAAADIGAFERQAAKISSIVFGDGTNQRSMVKQIVVTFSEAVTITGADAFTLARNGANSVSRAVPAPLD